MSQHTPQTLTSRDLLTAPNSLAKRLDALRHSGCARQARKLKRQPNRGSSVDYAMFCAAHVFGFMRPTDAVTQAVDAYGRCW